MNIEIMGGLNSKGKYDWYIIDIDTDRDIDVIYCPWCGINLGEGHHPATPNCPYPGRHAPDCDCRGMGGDR